MDTDVRYSKKLISDVFIRRYMKVLAPLAAKSKELDNPAELSKLIVALKEMHEILKKYNELLVGADTVSLMRRLEEIKSKYLPEK